MSVTIRFEGLQESGKTTLSRLIRNYLTKNDVPMLENHDRRNDHSDDIDVVTNPGTLAKLRDIYKAKEDDGFQSLVDENKVASGISAAIMSNTWIEEILFRTNDVAFVSGDEHFCIMWRNSHNKIRQITIPESKKSFAALIQILRTAQSEM